MSIIITGDTHIPITASRILEIGDSGMEKDKNFLIICGDFGLLWLKIPDKVECEWIELLNKQPFITLFVDGNHENHDRLASLPVEHKFGSLVGKISDSIYHLKRGNIYTIENKTFLAVGGAFSVDAWHFEEYPISHKPKLVWDRKPGKTWWPTEEISKEEELLAMNNLRDHNMSVDYIISHTCPDEIAKQYLMTQKPRFSDPGFLGKKSRKNEAFLSEVVKCTNFKRLFFGHWHDDWSTYDYKDGIKRYYHMLYYDIKDISMLEQQDIAE